MANKTSIQWALKSGKQANKLHNGIVGRGRLDIQGALKIGAILDKLAAQCSIRNKGLKRGSVQWVGYKKLVNRICNFTYMQGQRYRRLLKAKMDGMKIEKDWGLSDAYIAAKISKFLPPRPRMPILLPLEKKAVNFLAASTGSAWRKLYEAYQYRSSASLSKEDIETLFNDPEFVVLCASNTRTKVNKTA